MPEEAPEELDKKAEEIYEKWKEGELSLEDAITELEELADQGSSAAEEYLEELYEKLEEEIGDELKKIGLDVEELEEEEEEEWEEEEEL